MTALDTWAATKYSAMYLKPFKAAERIMDSLNKKVSEIPNCPVSAKLSIGLAAYRSGETDEELIRRVDNALYEAKNTGRNCIS